MEAQTHPSGISGTRRAMKEMADGTIRVQVDIDPAFRMAFLQMFPNIDMPVALAPLLPDFERKAHAANDAKPKGGEIAKWLGIRCADPDFQEYIAHRAFETQIAVQDITGPDACAKAVRQICEVESRAELDNDQAAADRFHDRIREPWIVWQAAD